MTKPGFFIRLLGSPVLSAILLTGALVLGGIWQKREAAKNLADVGGFQWSQHPNTLLLSHPKTDCGCGLSPGQWIQKGLDKDLDVLILFDDEQPKWKALTTRFPERVSVITNASPQLVKQFNPAGI